MKKVLLFGSLAALVLLVAAQCGSEEPPQVVKETVVVTREVEVEIVVTQEVEVMLTPTPAPALEVPFKEQWAASAHADATAEAFRHWDEEDPAQIPESCAKCHSAPGFLDFLGADGSASGVVDSPAEIGTVINCVACHNDVTLTKDSVVFPSGLEITGLGPESRCMECHQGRASTQAVKASIEEAGLTDDDAVSPDLGFTNIHYYAAAATQAGSTAMGGYQYEGKPYDAKFAHVEMLDSCIECHNSHTLEIELDECQACHANADSVEGLRNVRTEGSLVDYDGDGDMAEGIFYEVEGLRDMLYQAMQTYASEVAGTPIAYDSQSYPYFFIDTNGNGEVDEDEAAFPNQFNAWTGRLAKAAYNYQTSLKDPGAYAHGGKYIIQLLYDSIEDLNAALSNPVDLSQARRIDHGHFAGSEEAFRHWDEEEPAEVPADCSKCHSAEGLPLFAQDQVSITQEPSNGFLCATCHTSLTEEGAPRYEFTEVEFPSGLVIDAESADANTLLCMNCHQGRESTVSVNNAIAGLPPNTVAEELGFLNIHYFAAGATRYGTEAKGGYEYDGQSYNGYFIHVRSIGGCTDCHSTHTLNVKLDTCANCHENSESQEALKQIRVYEIDYDGDGDVSEGIAGEIATIHDALYVALQEYAANTVGVNLVYDSHQYPYFFVDTNGDGVAGPDEAIFPNRYTSWTPRLLQAAYNYQYVAKDPGAFAHNGDYVLQLLYDSLRNIGGDVSGMTRPEVRFQ
jgi:hypothetical protein